MKTRPGSRSTRDLLGGRDEVAELGVLFLFIIAVAVVTSLPYIYGYRSAPAGKQFMGILLNVPDTAQYLSWARELSTHVLIRNKLTSETGPAVFFNPFWLVVGRLALALHLGFAEALQVVRPFAGAIYLAAAYWFIGLFARDKAERWVSFLVICLGGGLGWLEVVRKASTSRAPSPLDLYVYEPNTFLSILAFPLQAMADGLLVLILGITVSAFERKSKRLALLAGVLGLVLGFAHGYDLVIMYAVVGTTALSLAFRDHNLIQPFLLAAIIGLVSAPAALYVFLLSWLSPMWRGVLAQYGNAGIFTPSPFHLVVLMGLPLLILLSVRGERSDLRTAATRDILLAGWLVVGFALLYIPTNFQIKMLGGWQIPLGIFATRALFIGVIPNLHQRMRFEFGRTKVLIGALLVAAVLPTNLYLYAWRFVDLGRHSTPYYLTVGDVEALDWLQANSNHSDVVLSSQTTGQYVPSIAGDNAFLAHWAMTLNYYHKRDLVRMFYSGSESDVRRREVAERYDIRYVIYGPEERALGDYDPRFTSWLTQVYSNGDVSVYQIKSPQHLANTRSQPEYIPQSLDLGGF